MNEQFHFLFHYLKKNEVTVDKTEFLFQVNSHPDYPSLLAISDTLSFFNIDNGALKVDFDELDLLPDSFVLLLNNGNKMPEFYCIEKRQEGYSYVEGKKTIEISKVELEKRWGNIVLIIDKPELNLLDSKPNFRFVLALITSVLFLVLFFQVNESLKLKFFILFPIFGILFSIASLKDLFGTKSELISNFCNISVSTSCESIINSDKWKLFKFLNFSSLSIVFYFAQFVAFIFFILLDNFVYYFTIQKVLLLCSLPIIGLSIYYQKFIEKKWCPICLAIISIILLELGYILIFINTNFSFSFNSVLLFLSIFSFIAFVWSLLKPLLSKQKELKEFQLKGNRFMRNYSIFKNNLLSKEKTSLPLSPIIIGNPAAKTEIAILTNPFCGHCKGADLLLNKILQKNNNLKIKFLFNVDFSREDEDKKLFFRNLLGVYFEKGREEFSEALTYWFENKNINEWLKIYQNNSNSMIIDELFFKQHAWCVENHFTMTPLIFIEGYSYPLTYERENLEFFINDIIEDDF